MDKYTIFSDYEKAKTPYQIIMKSNQIDSKTKDELKLIYENANPAEIKRILDRKLDTLCKTYGKKRDSQAVDRYRKQVPFTVSKYMINQKDFGVLVK